MKLNKRLTCFFAVSLLLEATIFTAIAKADDRDVSPDERERIVQTLKSIGCNSFNNAEYYSNHQRFEIDNVICENGRQYEIYLDQNYRIIKKELEDEGE